MKFRVGWWIVTPWKRKFLGRVLPEVVKRHGEFLSMPGLGSWYDVYILKDAVVMWRASDC